MPNTYRTTQGDTWDIVSFKVYGSEKYVDILIAENYRERERVFFPSGIMLNVPTVELETQDSRNLPPWKRSQ